MTYDPSEQRDYRGRWTASSGGAMHTAPGFPSVSLTDAANTNRAKAIAEKAEQVARALDFKPEKMVVTDIPHKFTINGQEYTEGGHYNPQTEGITLRHGLDPDAHDGVIAHEIMHAKFDAFIKDYRAERDAMDKDPDYLATQPKWEKAPGADDGTIRPTYPTGGKDTFMRPNGSLLEPYASRYPLYTKYQEVYGGTVNKGTNTEDFARTDGVSAYSRDYWSAWQKGEVGAESAIHETLAEMARVKWEAQRDVDAHKANVKYIKANGGQWSADDEKQWKQSFASGQRDAYRNYKLSKTDVDGAKVYFATLTRVQRKNWNDLYDAIDWNWNRRNKK